MSKVNDVIVKISKINEKGVFAARDFQKNEVVLNWHPKTLNELDVNNLSGPEKNYLIKDGQKIKLMQIPERYVNHSCNPNTKPGKNCDIATRDIKNGEEITTDYSGGINPGFVCHCGSKNCKGVFES